MGLYKKQLERNQFKIVWNTREKQHKMFQPSPKIQVNIIRQRRRVSRLPRIGSSTTTCKDTCQENLRQYLLHTTLHGLKYVGDNTITFFER